MFHLGRFQIKRLPPIFRVLMHSSNHFSHHSRYSDFLRLSLILDGYNLFKLKGGSAKIKSNDSFSSVDNKSKQSPWYNFPKLVLNANSTLVLLIRSILLSNDKMDDLLLRHSLSFCVYIPIFNMMSNLEIPIFCSILFNTPESGSI